MTAVPGLRGTGDWSADERPKDFRETILFFRPNGTTPIFSLTSKMGKRKATDPEFSWWNETLNNVRLQVSAALGAGDTLVTVDSPDPNAANLGRNYGLATHLKPGDLLLVVPTTDAVTYNHEIIRVETVVSATQFTASRGAGGTTAAAIADNQFLWLIGSSYAEGTGAPEAVSRNPVKYNNFTQIFKNTYELTGTTDKTTARTGPAWSNDKKRKMFDHSRDIELGFLYGQPSETTGTNGKPQRTMGGIRQFIPASNTTVFGAAVTSTSFLDAVTPVFDFESEGGDTRMAFAGNTAITELAKVFSTNSNVRINFDQKFSTFGVDFVEFIMPRGRLLLRSHPLLSREDSIYSKAMFIIDQAALKYVFLDGRDTRVRDDVQNKDEDVRRGYIQTEASLMLDYGGLTSAYLGNISAT